MTHSELVENEVITDVTTFLKKVQSKKTRAAEIIEEQGFVFKGTGKKGELTEVERWEKLAFTFYTKLVGLDLHAEHLLEDLTDKPEDNDDK